MSTSFHILSAAVVTEGLLIIVAFIFAGLFGVTVQWRASWVLLALGMSASLPLLFTNHLLWRWSRKHPASVYARFSETIIVPLCRQITPLVAVLLAAMSGFGEELFFRGVFNLILAKNLGLVAAAVLTSVIFAYVHFVGLVKTYGGMLPLYSAVGLYFWLLHYCTESLFTVVVTHATYNLCAIIWVRATNTRSTAPSNLTRTNGGPLG
jgi:membrane protease YdiL (CAAX protease family)